MHADVHSYVPQELGKGTTTIEDEVWARCFVPNLESASKIGFSREPDEAMNADGPAAAEVPAAAVPKNAGGSTQSGSTPVADEEANLLLTSEAPESGVSCLNVTRIVLALPFIFAGMVGIMFFWLLWVLLLPIEHCCQCGQQPCLAGTREWLDKGARLPLALLKWATQ
jgi:hypothetical protein